MLLRYDANNLIVGEGSSPASEEEVSDEIPEEEHLNNKISHESTLVQVFSMSRLYKILKPYSNDVKIKDFDRNLF